MKRFGQPLQHPTGVLLLGNYRPTLAVARALAPLGYRISVFGTGGEGAAEFSRHVAQVIAVPDTERAAVTGWLSDPAALLRNGIGMVMPVTESACRAIAAHQRGPDGQRHAPASDIVWVTPAADAVLACLDKPAMFARCETLGLPTEPFRKTTRQHLPAAIEAVGLPCVVRPEDSTHRIGDEKAIFVESLARLKGSALDALPGHVPLIVQRKAAGVRHNVYFAASRGRLAGVCEARIDRTDRLDGSGLAVEGITVEPNPVLVDWTECLTRSLDYTGIGCAQYLVDAGSGDYAFLEINPRVPGNHAIAEAAGLPLARLAVDLAMNQLVAAPMIVGRPGLRFAWTYGDLRGLREAVRNGEVAVGAGARWLARTAAAALSADVHMTWTGSDPRPTLRLFARQFAPRWLEPRQRAAFALGSVRRT